MRKTLTVLAAVAALTLTAACGADSDDAATEAGPTPAVDASPGVDAGPDAEATDETLEEWPDTPPPIDNDITLSLLDEDGYTSDLHLQFPNWIFVDSLLNAPPGEADVVWSPPFDYAFELINTTDGRRTPTHGVEIYGYYPEDSAACDGNEYATGLGYCSRMLMDVEANEDEIDPAGTLWLSPDPENGLTGNSYRHSESEAAALADALSQPAGYIFKTSQYVEVTAGGDCRNLAMSSSDGIAPGTPDSRLVTAVGPICG